MWKCLALVSAALAAQGCTQGGAPNAATGAAPETDPQRAEARRGDVYVATSSPRDGASMLAMFGGRFEVTDGCLVLRSPDGLHVPVFVPSADPHVTARSAVIGGRAVALGAEVQVAGGEMGINDDSALDRPRPARCRHRLLRISSWAPAS